MLKKIVMLLCCATIALSSILACAESEDDIFLTEGLSPVQTETSYKSQNISITITSMRYMRSDVYVADVYIKDLKSLQTVYPGEKWGKKSQRLEKMSEDADAILAITGDSAPNLIAGWAVTNGEAQRTTSNKKRDIAIILYSGEMKTILAQDINYDELEVMQQNNEIWQLFLFGPSLLDEEGHAKTTFNTSVGVENPRSVIGYYEPGHFCFVQVDGRKTKSALEEGKKNYGLDMKSLSVLMESLGCKAAYNLDGGRSSLLYFNGEIQSTPYKGARYLPNILVIKEVEQ